MTETARPLSKLTVIGAGSVGSSLAYAALIRNSAPVVSLFDIAEQRVNAEVRDLAHGTQYTHSVVMGGADLEVTKDSSVIIITAGARQKPGQSRLDLAGVNAGIIADLMPKLVKLSPDALFVIVTNPCDVLTVVAQKASGLPASRVFSTGTMLDSSRLRYLISQRTNVRQGNVHVNVIGEHGDSEFPAWSTAAIGGVPIQQWQVHGQEVFNQAELDELATRAKNAAYSIIEGKGATNYAIGLAGAALTEALLSPNRAIIPLSTTLDGYLGVSGVALSMPALVSANGVKRIIEIPMDDAEQQAFKDSAARVQQTLREIGY